NIRPPLGKAWRPAHDRTDVVIAGDVFLRRQPALACQIVRLWRCGMTPTMPIAILARAPLPGQTKTRLIPALGADGAAQLQAQLIAHSVAKCAQAALGPVTLFATPDLAHPLFERIAAYHDIA